MKLFELKRDSGGPVIQIINGKVYQFISSPLLLFFSELCFPSNPSFYTKVSKFIDWIETSIKEFDDSKDDKIKTEY